MPKIHQTGTMPVQGGDQNVKTTPLQHPRTVRTDYKRVLTTTPGGKFTPLFAIPLLREDRLNMTRFRFGIEMAETADMLMNPVRVAVHCWFVPKLAFERFLDLGHLNRSYMGKAESDLAVTDWFQDYTFGDGAETDPNIADIFKTMGLHAVPGSDVNSDYIEAYNAIWNHVAKQTSPSLTERVWADFTIAPAFWPHSSMRHVKPTFDQALMHGEVPLEFVAQDLPVRGIGFSAAPSVSSQTVTETQGARGPHSATFGTGSVPNIEVLGDGITPQIFAELSGSGVTVSLSNIDLARKTTGFARARQEYQGLNDDELIDLLMSGVRIPDETLNHPLLLGRQDTVLGMSQRYATDSGNLDKSATRGQTEIDMGIMVPQTNTGGVVMAIMEILPEQMYERQEDVYLSALSVADLPERLRDELDSEPVDVVTNQMVDTDHSDPTGLFGYAPRNHRWMREAPNIGGLYYRPRADEPWNENRNRIWAVETVDPALGDDFYLASNIHHEVFADTVTDQFEVQVTGLAQIEGNTYFGPELRESTGDYEKVAAKSDTSRLDLTPS